MTYRLCASHSIVMETGAIANRTSTRLAHHVLQDKKYLLSVLIPIAVGFAGAMLIIVMAYVSRAYRKRKDRTIITGAPRSFLEVRWSCVRVRVYVCVCTHTVIIIFRCSKCAQRAVGGRTGRVRTGWGVFKGLGRHVSPPIMSHNSSRHELLINRWTPRTSFYSSV